MKTTTVRITDEQHQWIVENRPYQLSRIVREHLDVLIHAETPVSFHNAWRESAQKCYPHMRGGYCSLCWPAGTPSRQEWTDYIRQNGVGSLRNGRRQNTSIDRQFWKNGTISSSKFLEKQAGFAGFSSKNPESTVFTPHLTGRFSQLTMS